MIALKHVQKKYHNKTIFQSLNMMLENQQLTVLLGENGAGKSTLLRMLSGLEKPDQGEITYFGKKLSKKQLQAMIGYVPQDIALFEHMTVAENIDCFKALCKNAISDALITKYMEQLNIDDLDITVSRLSGGTKRKVNVLIGLLNNPQVLILDEPTVGIDLKSRFDIHNLLNQMKRNCLIILTTHHLDEVEALADCIKVIGVDPFYKKVLSDKQWQFESYQN
ncbi:ABC transporter ATP-binding protein [Staphylococcus cohnii]|uniref:ABC transporter ATP-binding protein n=1 Tax=Staphylococcus cohnii TaxID=29382 RepID=UPI000D19AE89|nr:ABC transporter ATP-binding protein [Staphylococcus cohnii]PTF06724.1 multidrug ABC transporter ATP-binding protein [Staphylococcus cohnii]PTG66844.1 multidrug ABC transporter ATP-binding protein [Staphylococcus cohnii]